MRKPTKKKMRLGKNLMRPEFSLIRWQEKGRNSKWITTKKWEVVTLAMRGLMKRHNAG